ncbi:MAG: M81 family metallopeptidase [Rhodobacter sp.]|nr:M81 family metallopeptidase [Rhodobacter sp.]
MRIAVAGFQHETNTFAPGSAGFEQFRLADSWPGLLQGTEVVSGTRAMNLPIAGAVAALEGIEDVQICPLLWCAAEPCGPVTDEAFDKISGMILDDLAAAGPLDGLFLDLHGAMVTETHDDGEGELLARIRAVAGPDLPIGVSLDLHANLSAQMVDAATLITVFRTYPHLDMAVTGARCIAEMMRRINGLSRCVAFRQAPFLIPAPAQHTGSEPCRSLYAKLDDRAPGTGEYVELALGFTASDIADCGPSVLAYAETQTRADTLADEAMARLCVAEPTFDARLLSAEDAVKAAMKLPGHGPVVLADVQDNPGAGATSDTTGLLQALIDCQASGALLGVMHDPDIAARAHSVGIGAGIDGALGGRSGHSGHQPVSGRFKVLSLSDGQIAYTGEMYGGGTAEVGPSCLLAFEDVPMDIKVVVSSERIQCLDRALFTHFGADPDKAKIVCVKSTVHFRADFEKGSRAVLNVGSPGAFLCQLDIVPYRNLRPGLRLGPRGPAFSAQVGTSRSSIARGSI